MKKKGLIISTIVMVVVLIASLTTATYAWFSSNAEVTVDNLNIQAQATEGLEIALKTTVDSTYTTGYTYGAVNYDAANNKWTSDDSADGFGSNLDFAAVEVGTISNAVTNNATDSSIPDEAQYVYTAIDDPGTLTTNHYTISADGLPTQCEAGASVSGTQYYTRAAVVAGTYYVPTGYDENVKPLGFFAVNPNARGTYYDLPIRIKSTMDVQAILCTLSINSTSSGVFAPGMAAATRVSLGLRKGETGNETVYTGYTPYSSATSTVSGMTGVNVDEASFSFVVAYASGEHVVSSANVYTVHVILWVEGTDPECNNYTTSATNFDVNFAFSYTKTALTVSDNAATVEGTSYHVLTGTVVENA